MMLKRVIIIGITVAVTVAVSLHADQVLSSGGGGVALQPSSPGSAQTGNVNVQGNAIVSSSTANPSSADVSRISTATGGASALFVNRWAWSGSGFFPPNFNTASTNNGQQYLGWYSVSNSLPLMLWGSYVPSGVNPGYFNMQFSGCDNGGIYAPCIAVVGSNGIPSPLTLGGMSGNNTNNRVVITTGSGGRAVAGNVFEVQNPPSTVKFGVDINGAITTATPISLTSGGTGTATALNCPYVGSNGTSFSCTAAPSAILGSGRIAADGTIAVQNGLTITVTKGGTGNYTVNVTGMTVSGVTVVTPTIPGGGAGRHATVLSTGGSFAVQMKSGADGLIDSDFNYAILSL